MRMSPNMPQIAMQKAVFCTLKGHLSQCERWPFGKPLIISGLANNETTQNNKGAFPDEMHLCLFINTFLIQRMLSLLFAHAAAYHLYFQSNHSLMSTYCR